MEKIIVALGGRKFLFTIGVVVVGTLIELKTDRGISSNFVTLLLGAAGLFTTGNSVSKLIYGKYDSSSEATESTVDLGTYSADVKALVTRIDDVQSKVASTTALLETIAQSTANTQKILGAALVNK